MRLDNPLLVQWEYASEERLVQRNALFRELIRGENPEEIAFAQVGATRPQRLLDVGCGTGEFADRAGRELGCEVMAIDISQRMVELTRQLGVDARVGDVQALPHEQATFDCVAALWVLYHAADVDCAVAECARVLVRGGRLVAATLGDNIAEVWDLVGEGHTQGLSFDARNGDELLRRHFAAVDRRDVESELVFPDAAAVRTLVAATITNAHLAPRVPELDGELRATLRHTIFTATKA
jgi:SAM-dependent methyltransferase